MPPATAAAADAEDEGGGGGMAVAVILALLPVDDETGPLTNSVMNSVRGRRLRGGGMRVVGAF